MEAKQENSDSKWARLVKGIISTLFLGVAIYFSRAQFSIDFWYDEVMSLEEFILVPISKTLTDYPAPNNHIFFNLLMNLWCKLWGINTFAQAANNVFIVRLLPLFFTLTTILFVYLTGKKYFSKGTAFISIIILLTTIPFYNFAAQVRGYGLSIMLCSMLLYCALGFYSNPKTKYGAAVAVLAALLLYTIPSNLYAVLSALVVLGFIFISQWYKYHFRIAIQFNAAKLIGYLLLGGAIAVLLYLPVANQVVSNEYVKSEGLFRGEIWGEAGQIFTYIFKPYYVLLLIIVLGVIVALVKKVDLRVIGVLALLIALPFVFSFIQGGKPFDRTFLWICPLVVLLAALSGEILYNYWIKNTVLSNAMRGLILIALMFSFDDARKDIDAQLTKGLVEGVKHQNIYYNYYLAHYHPNKKLDDFKREYYADSIPVFLHEVDKYAMHGYLPIHGINWEPNTDMIAAVDRYFVITAFEDMAITNFQQYDSTFEFHRISGDIDFVNIIEAKRGE